MGFLRAAIRAGKAHGNNPKTKGNYGEMIVSSIFDPRFFGKEEHYIVNNIIFESEKGRTHQIDHIVIHKTGVFVIETKHMRGIIKGKEDDAKWIQILDKPRNMLNPVIQNQTHVKIVNAFLEDNYDIHSIVVFTKSNKPSDAPDYVLNLEELKDYVKNYKTFNELSSGQMKEIYDLLIEYKKNCNVTSKEHIKNVMNV